jgi:hypothetical protein
MASHKNRNLVANENLVIFLTSKLITWFIGGFTLKMRFRPIVYLLNESEHIYWIWDLEDEVHSIWDLWISGLHECKGNGFFEVGRADGQRFLVGWLPLPEYSSPEKFVVGGTWFGSPKEVVSWWGLQKEDKGWDMRVQRSRRKVKRECLTPTCDVCSPISADACVDPGEGSSMSV